MLDLDAAVQLQEPEVAAVEHELGRARAAVADRRARTRPRPRSSARAARGRARGRAPPRAPSGGGAAPSTRARRARRSCPASRRAAGSRRAAAARRSARRRRARRRTPPSPRACAAARASSSSVGSRTTRIPRPPPPAAALIDQREADLVRLALRHDRHAGLARDPLRLELVAAGAQRLGRRPDPGQARGLDRLGEVGVLGEEAVAGMDRVGAGLLRRAHVLAGVEVRGDANGLVGRARVQRAGVVLRRDRHGRDPELAAGPEDPQRDLAAVRYEELLDAHDAPRFSRKARRPSWPSSLVRRWAMRRSVPRPSGRSSTSFFACRAASGPAVRSSATIAATAGVEVGRHLVDEPDPQRRRGVEALARDEVAPRRARLRSSPARTARSRPG